MTGFPLTIPKPCTGNSRFLGVTSLPLSRCLISLPCLLASFLTNPLLLKQRSKRFFLFPLVLIFSPEENIDMLWICWSDVNSCDVFSHCFRVEKDFPHPSSHATCMYKNVTLYLNECLYPNRQSHNLIYELCIQPTRHSTKH